MKILLIKSKDRLNQAKKSCHLYKLTSLIAILIILMVPSVFSQGMSSARSVALGSASTALATGIDAARFNPANLGLKSHQSNELEILGFGANISNNAFTLGDYNKYTGAFLTGDDKADILNKVPNSGLKLTAEADASSMALSQGPFVFAISGTGLADINLNKDILELVLNGNTYADTIDITGSYSEAVGMISASVSYGKSIYKSGTRELAIGASAKYLYGLGVEKVVDMQGMAATYAAGFAGEGKLIARTATGGTGYALDIGAALKLNNDYTIGARIKNFISTFTWNQDTKEHGYIFNFDTMTVDNMDADYIVSDDYSKPIGNFSTNLPSTMNIGIANTSGDFLWAVDWEQGFRSTIGATTKPRLSMGVEWTPIKTIPLRSGFSTGGRQNTSFSFGSGFNLPLFFIDYAVVTGGSLSGYSTKGINFALTTGLHF